MEENTIINNLKLLARSISLSLDFDVVALVPSGSPRRYYRLSDGKTSYIGTFVPDPSEGKCFVRLAHGFAGVCPFVPRILAFAPDFRFYIQEDLGDVSLFSTLGSPEAASLVKETLTRLATIQKSDEKIWSSACMARQFSKRQIMWDLNYFKYEFLKTQETVFDEDLLEDDFDRLSRRLATMPDELMGFMLRDCQSRNVMVSERGPVFIDFQGGRKGPVLYDAVSLLWQARAGFDEEFRMRMLKHYCDVFFDGDRSKIELMMSFLDDMVTFRTLQVLGAYGFRGLVQRKAHFILSIPGALSNLRSLLEKGALDDYPELRRCSESLVSSRQPETSIHIGGLTVEIFSFSYKKGYPEDLSGNGGGFMFDCRALHNPGRYAEYRNLTGRDKEVIDFLEKRGEVKPFLTAAWSLTDAAIERYLARGFTRLQIGFGCTGGQHRSVYSAERTASHIRELFPEVCVCLVHREHPEN